MFKEGDTVKIKSTNSWAGYRYLKGQKGFATLKSYHFQRQEYEEVVFFSKKSLELIREKK